MPLDITYFREEKGGDVKTLRESNRARGKPDALIDEIIDIDQRWRKATFNVQQEQKKKGQNQKAQTDMMKKDKTARETPEFKALVEGNLAIDKEIARLQIEEKELSALRDKKVSHIGNIVHPSVPVSNNEENNQIVATWGEKKGPACKQALHHHELLWMIDGYEPERGVDVAGHRAYFLKGVGVLLNQALINFGLAFLMRKGYTPIQPPFFMRKEVMSETAQLEEFDEALYKVTGEEGSEALYLIATSEQPISALHRHERLAPESLPIRYAGISSCFRKEAGAHGRDTWGIFRIHQFEKVEQFVLTEPEKSWEMLEEMIGASQEFYQALGFHYRVVNIVSGVLNNAAAKKYDLEAWFPTLGVYRELVSCSNCTDYQSRAMGIHCGMTKTAENKFVHLLNATLTATERTICCILENYQTDTGVVVPEVLRPFMGGIAFLPFKRPLESVPHAVSVSKDAAAAAAPAKGEKKDKAPKAEKAKQEKKPKTEAKAEAAPAAAETPAATAETEPAKKGGKGKKEAKKEATAPAAAAETPAATPPPASPEPAKKANGKKQPKAEAKVEAASPPAAAAPATPAPASPEPKKPKAEAKKETPKAEPKAKAERPKSAKKPKA